MKALGALELLQGWVTINPTTGRAELHDQYVALGNSIVNPTPLNGKPVSPEGSYSAPDSGADY